MTSSFHPAQSQKGSMKPTLPSMKIMRGVLKDMGTEEREMPPVLRDKIVLRSKKGQLGAIKIRRVSGVVDNAASKTLRKFETNVGGKEEIVEKLTAIEPSLTKEQQELLHLMRENPKKGLARMVALSKAEPSSVMTAYARGCIELGKVEASIEAHRNLPGVIKDLVRHAIDQEVLCPNCLGTGGQKARKGALKETQVCVLCDGDGKSYKISAHKKFAAQKILEATGTVDSPGAKVQVQQTVGVKVGGSGGFMERTIALSDEILYGKSSKSDQGEVVEAEVVEECTTP